MKDIKNKIRLEIKNNLRANEYNFGKWSDIICKKILNSVEYKDCDVILAYMALSDEPDLTPVIAQAFLTGKQVYIPKIIPETNIMKFYPFNPDTIISGCYGIKEPGISFEAENQFEPLNDQNILILVPGRAFTCEGIRLGRGKGFYDIYLNQLLNKKGDLTNCKVTLTGICFNCQVLPDLPAETHDIKMNRIISEE